MTVLRDESGQFYSCIENIDSLMGSVQLLHFRPLGDSLSSIGRYLFHFRPANFSCKNTTLHTLVKQNIVCDVGRKLAIATRVDAALSRVARAANLTLGAIAKFRPLLFVT